MAISKGKATFSTASCERLSALVNALAEVPCVTSRPVETSRVMLPDIVAARFADDSSRLAEPKCVTRTLVGNVRALDGTKTVRAASAVLSELMVAHSADGSTGTSMSSGLPTAVFFLYIVALWTSGEGIWIQSANRVQA